jgi:galactoside 2-L-fucosyltransferase 1/2
MFVAFFSLVIFFHRLLRPSRRPSHLIPVERRYEAGSNLLARAAAISSSLALGPGQRRKTILVGIFSNAHTFDSDRSLRDAYRVSINASGPFSFELRHLFVVGREADVRQENAAHGDIYQGDFAENMNEGKTLQWLRAASKMQADFVIKMDQDTAVEWSKLDKVAALRPPVYFGTRVLHWAHDLSISPVRGPAPSNQCRDFSGSCWFYMSGGFYGVSMDVGVSLAGCPFAFEHGNGIEDANVGFWMHACHPQVQGHEFAFGDLHYHYVRDKRNMEQKVLNQQIGPAELPPSGIQVSVTLIGGLGNQLFQAASSFGIATSRGAAWCVTNLHGSVLQRSVDFAVAPAQCDPGVQRAVLDENGDFLGFQQRMMDEPSSVHVQHYLQSFRYFAISGLPFALRTRAYGEAWVREHGVRVGIHVRRTDQLTEAHGGKDPGVGYFALGLATLRNLTTGLITAVVSTDDVEWVNRQDVFRGMIIRHGGDPGEDMAVLAACDHLILSIGTFGWWAAYQKLRPGEVVYYATPFRRPLNYHDFYPSSWISISDEDVARAGSAAWPLFQEAANPPPLGAAPI